MKKIVTITLATALVLGGSIAINHGYAQEDDQKNTETAQAKERIGIEKAKTAALKEADGTVESVELEKDNGNTYYEVDINKDNKEYDIDVDAYSAKILNVKESQDDDDDDDREDQASTVTKEAIITENEAIAIAKKNITGELIEIELDEDDGRYEYDMEFKTTKGEAEITIDAHNKNVLELENDDDDDDE